MKLEIQWNARLKLKAEGYKLRAEGYKLMAEGDKLWAEGYKLKAEGYKLMAEGDKLWADAILAVYGNIKLEWKWRDNILDCELENGEIYRGDDESSP